MAASVITLTRDRNRHLKNLVTGLGRQEVPASELIVARMGGEDPGAALEVATVPCTVVDVPSDDLPLAAARNAGARAASSDDLIFIDVDCIPAHGLVGAFGARLEMTPDLVLQGPVAYLREGVGLRSERKMRAESDRRPERERELRREPEGAHRHFWSLNFALRRETFERVGGFDEGYVGYGIEDTDFAFRLARAGIGLGWEDYALAFHQHHPERPLDPQRIPALVANAERFFSLWGEWPAPGWLAELADEGLISWEPEGSSIELR